jgi:hypothetical protein
VGVAVTGATAVGADHAMRPAKAYKALPGATYGGGEEAGGLLSKSPRLAGSLLPSTVQASRPSREGTITAVVIRGEKSSGMRGSRPAFPPGLYPPVAGPMAGVAVVAGTQFPGGDAMRTQLSHATQRRKR